MAIELATANFGYPLPHPANDLSEDVLRLIAALNMIDATTYSVIDQLNGKAARSHGHNMGQISGLSAALADKAALDHVHTLDSLTDVDTSGAANGQFLKRVGTSWGPANIAIGDVAELSTRLSAKADIVGTSLVVPSGTSSNRPADPQEFVLRFNTTLEIFEFWHPSTDNWNSLIVNDVLARSQNLADLVDKAAARNNLGISFSPNLLINSYGTINQRGTPDGDIDAASNIFLRDRWQVVGNPSSARITNVDGLWSIVFGGIRQTIENGFLHKGGFAGKQVTVAVDNPDKSVDVWIGTPDGTAGVSGVITAGAGARSVTLTVGATVTGNLRVNFRGSNVTFRNPRLAVGVNPPMSVDRDDFELCQRYYARLPVYIGFYAASAAHILDTAFYYPVKMRGPPTLSVIPGVRSNALATLGPTFQTGFRYSAVSQTAGNCYVLADVVVADAETPST